MIMIYHLADYLVRQFVERWEFWMKKYDALSSMDKLIINPQLRELNKKLSEWEI